MQRGYIEVPKFNEINSSAGARGFPSLDAMIFAGGGLALLFLGSWVPDQRLNFSGIQVDTIARVLACLLVTLGAIRSHTLHLLALLQLPLLLLGVTIAWSPDPQTGVNNITSLVLTSFLAFLLLNTVIERHDKVELARALLLFFAAYLGAAIIYKAIFGFFDRGVMFLLNGPIVFARFMSIALILSLWLCRGPLRIVTATAFYAAIIWTESKGPILAATVTVLALFWLSSGRIGRAAVVLCSLVAIAGLFAATNYFGVSFKEIGRLAVLLNTFSGDTTLPMLARLSGRGNLWELAVDLIFSYPMGVGLGGYKSYWGYTEELAYPHNLFLELWCEGGIVLGTIASIPLLLFLPARKDMFWYVAFCLFLAQMVSGDIGDARFMYVFGLLAILSTNTTKDRVVGAFGGTRALPIRM